MILNQTLHEIIYVSTIASSATVGVVPAIASASRSWNKKHDITGLLIFDGMTFCQQIEGPQQAVMTLIERISNDSRHSNMSIVHSGELRERRFRNFSLAFTNVEDIEVLVRIEKLNGQASVSAFVDLLATLEMPV